MGEYAAFQASDGLPLTCAIRAYSCKSQNEISPLIPVDASAAATTVRYMAESSWMQTHNQQIGTKRCYMQTEGPSQVNRRCNITAQIQQ